MEIKGILVTLVAPMEDHIANGGEKILGNASSIKRRPDGRVYVSGQMQRHALFSAIERLNFGDEGRDSTYVSNGDGVTNIIENDLRADLGGYLHTKIENYSGRRTAPLTATPAVAFAESEVGRDLLIRLKMDQNGERDQALATREFSQYDEMNMSFFVDVGAVGIRRRCRYEGEHGWHVKTEHVPHIDDTERRRRIRLALEATASLTDYANQARNATSGEPQKVLIVFDTKLSRKAARYFRSSEIERKNIIAELKARGAGYFLGDDTIDHSDQEKSSEVGKEANEEDKIYSVHVAYQKALDFFDDKAKNCLWTPPDLMPQMTTEQFEKGDQSAND